MNKVLFFGELLLRISPSAKGNWIYEHNIPIYPAGSEANAAVALANWDVPVKYCSAFPDNYMAQTMLQYLRERKIDTSPVLLTGKKIGLYFLEEDADLKHASVIYDREHSSFSEVKRGMFDWKEIFDGVSWLHFSAICPALNENVADVCMEAVEAASALGITISIDLNYRNKLWQYGKQPTEVMPVLLQYCDVVMGNIWSANKLLGIGINESLLKADVKNHYLQHGKQTAEELVAKFPKCKTVVNTFRFDKDHGIEYFATLYNNGQQFVSKEFATHKIICKIGSGDCCMAGLIYGLYHRHTMQEVINFAAAAAFGKLQERTDFTNQSVRDVLTLIHSYE